jgi:hypothetical protein
MSHEIIDIIRNLTYCQICIETEREVIISDLSSETSLHNYGNVKHKLWKYGNNIAILQKTDGIMKRNLEKQILSGREKIHDIRTIVNFDVR